LASNRYQGIAGRSNVEWEKLKKQRKVACDEPFGREFRVKRLRVERLSRIEGGIKKRWSEREAGG
jgi:hypothetical protein